MNDPIKSAENFLRESAGSPVVVHAARVHIGNLLGVIERLRPKAEAYDADQESCDRVMARLEASGVEMREDPDAFVCVGCGARKAGRYCSSCGTRRPADQAPASASTQEGGA